MNSPVPTGRTEGEKKFLSMWGKALEKVGRRHDDLPAIRRGQRLQEANTENQKQSDAEEAAKAAGPTKKIEAAALPFLDALSRKASATDLLISRRGG